MPKTPDISSDQGQLFDLMPSHDARQMFKDGVPTPYRVEESTSEAEQDIDRLDSQGQTNQKTALGRLGVGRDMIDGTIYPERSVGSPSPRQHKPRPWETKNSRTRNAKELRAADQPPAHEKYDPYA